MESILSTIKQKLESAFVPEFLTIEDESHRHAGHAGVPVGSTGETHFAVTIVSKKFAGLPRVKRHQLVYGVLAEELKTPVHALALKTLTPDEYAQ